MFRVKATMTFLLFLLLFDQPVATETVNAISRTENSFDSSNFTYEFEIVNFKEKLFRFSNDEIKQVTIQLRNTSASEWLVNQPINFAYHVFDENNNMIVYDGLRTDIPYDVAVGETVTIQANIKIPETPGTYYIAWNMVEEGVRWYSVEFHYKTKLIVINFIWKYCFYLMLVLSFCLLLYWLNRRLKFFENDIIRRITNHIVCRIDLILLFFITSLKIIYVSSLIEPELYKTAQYYIYSVTFITCLLLSFIHLHKKRIPYVLAFSFLTSSLLFANLVYNQYFQDVLTVSLLLNLNQISSVGDSILSLIKPQYSLLFIDLLVYVIVYLIIRKVVEVKYSKKIIVAISALSLVVVSISLSINVSKLLESDFFKKRYYNKLIVRDIGIVNYHIYDIVDFVVKKFDTISDSDLQAIKEWKQNQPDTTREESTFGIAKSKNLIIVQSEALQSFVIGLSYNGKEVTPNINEFIGSSLYFNNFYDQTNNGRTSDAEFTALVSLHPLPTSSVYTSYPFNTYMALPSILKNEGYHTFSAHGYRGDFWGRNIVHPKLGFDQSYFAENLEMDTIIGWGLSDESLFKQALNKIDLLSEPFFSFLITLTNHHPYEYLIPEQTFDVGELKGTLIGNYLESVHYADKQFGVFLAELKKKDYYNNTVLVLYGDHDAGIPFKDIQLIDERSVNASLTDKVPFAIRVPAINRGVINEKIAGHLDITPTLLHLFGIDVVDNYFMGKNLFSSDNSGVVFSNGDVLSEKFSYINGTCTHLNDNDECSSKIDDHYKKLEISNKIIQYNLYNRLIE